jgi:hypothetical protein
MTPFTRRSGRRFARALLNVTVTTTETAGVLHIVHNNLSRALDAAREQREMMDATVAR